MSTIRLQLVGEYFYPTDSVSASTLENLFGIARFPEHRFDTLAPKMIREGYSLAVADYFPVPTQTRFYGALDLHTGERKQSGPCLKCYLREACDGDICSMGWRKLCSR
jgi:hypothetical protein